MKRQVFYFCFSWVFATCSNVDATVWKAPGSDVTYLIDSTKLVVSFVRDQDAVEVDKRPDDFPFLTGVIPSPHTPDSFSVYGVAIADSLGLYISALRSSNAVRAVGYFYTTQQGYPVYFGDNFCVAFQEQIPRAWIDSVVASAGAQVLWEVPGIPSAFILRNSQTVIWDIIAISNYFSGLDEVRYAKPSSGVRARPSAYTVFDRYLSFQPHLKKTIGTTNVASVWDFFGLNEPVLVAVLDDGVTSHDDLPASRIVPGWSFGEPGPNAEPHTYSWHGMACAGAIGASHSTSPEDTVGRNSGVIGMNPHGRIMSVRLDNIRAPDEGFWTTPDQTAAAIGWAYMNGAVVLSCSFGWTPEEFGDLLLEDALWRAAHHGRGGKGSVVVFAAGNFGADGYDPFDFWGEMSYPSKNPNCIAVGAIIDGSDWRWDYSSRGDSLDLVAPSGALCERGNVWTLDQMGNIGCNNAMVLDECDQLAINWDCPPKGNDIDYNCMFGGTSYSAPLVAGAASLLISRDSNLTAQEIQNILKQSAVPLGYPHPNIEYGYGRLDAFRALLSITRGDANNDGLIDISDLQKIVDHLFFSGAVFPSTLLADCNCDGVVDVADLQYFISWYFDFGGDPPVKPCFQ